MGDVMKQISLIFNLPFSYGPCAFLGKMLAICFLSCATIVKADDRIDILMIGDSLTQGYGLIEQEGLVPQLRGFLSTNAHDVRLINAGVSGDTTAGGLERVAWSLEPGLEGAVVALGGNDMLRGIAPNVVRQNLVGILDELKGANLQIMVIGTYAPTNYGPEYKKEFDQIFPELAQNYDAIYVPSFFEPFITEGQLGQTASKFFQPDGLHPNAEGVKIVVESIGPSFLELVSRINE